MQLVFNVAETKNGTYKRASFKNTTKEVIDGEERTVDNYQKFVNPVVKYAYIKTQTNFGDSKIDISQDGAVLGSGNGEADATAFMSSDNIVLPVKVTAKDGATMNYKLFIEKASNNIALKIVEAKAQVAGTMMLTPVTATPVKMNEYVAEMPMGSEAATFRVVTEDPDTIIQLYDE